MAAQSRQTKAERELQAERLEANFGCDRALKVLEEVTRVIVARRPALTAIKSNK